MNIIDLGSIDRLVRRNSNLITAFKVIDEVDSDIVVENVLENIEGLDSTRVISHGNVLDIVSASDTIPISYYFAERYSRHDLKEILSEIKSYCEAKGIIYVE